MPCRGQPNGCKPGLPVEVRDADLTILCETMAAMAYGGHVIANHISSESQAGRDQQADMEGLGALPSLIMACLVDTCITATTMQSRNKVVRAEVLRLSMASGCMQSAKRTVGTGQTTSAGASLPSS